MTKDDNSNKIDLAQLQNININELLDTINIKIFQNHLDNIVFKELDPRFLSQHVRFETIKIFEILQLIFKENIRVQEELIGELNNSVSNYESEKEAINRKCRHIKEIKKSNLNSQSKIKRKQKEVCIVESLLQNVKDNQQTKRLESDRLYHQQNNNSTIHLYFVINDSLHPKEDDQLVVEMNEKRDQQIITIVALLQCKLDLIYKQQRGVNHTASGSTFVCKLMLRDKVVYDSSDIHRQAFDSRVTLSQIGVQDMDTITVTVEIPHTVAVIDEETVARQALHQQQQQHMELMSQRMDRVLTSQQDTMISIASEMRHGWETAMQSITALQTQHFQTEDAATTTMAKSSTAAVEAISQLRQEQESKARAETDRLARLECTIRDQLSSQFKEYDGRLHDALTQQSMQQRARVEELEINGENMTSAIKLSQSHIEKLDAELRSTRESIDDLRGSMTSHFSDLKSFQGDLQCNINDALMRLNERSTSTRRTSDQMIGTDPIIVEPIEILEEPPVPVVIEELEEAIFDHTPEIEPTNEPIIVPDVEITLQYFQTDSNTIRDQGPFETVIILTKFSLLSEELIFHMRREIAMQIRVPLAHTLLWWRGHPVRVWSDLVHVPSLEPETDAFTVNDAKERAGEGALKYTVATPAPMRDAQLDFLVSQHKSLLQAKSSNEVMDTSKQASTNRFMNDTMSSTSFFNRSLSPARVGKYYDVVEEGLIEGKSEDYNNRSIPRSRIVNAFEDLAGEFAQTEYLERLSETELREKLEDIRERTATLPDPIKNHISRYRDDLAEAMGTIKLDHLRQTSMLQAASEHTTSEFTDPLLQTMNTIRRAASIMSSRTQSPVRISNESTSTEKPDKPLKPAHLSRSSTPEKPAKPIRISRDSESDEPTRNSSKSSPTSKLNKDYDTKDDSEAKAEAGYYHNNLNMTTGGIPMSESVDTHKRVESTVSRSHSTQPRLINTSTRSSAAFTEGKGNNTLQKRTSTSIVSSSDSEEKEPCMDTPSAKLSPRLKPTPPLDPPPTVSPRALQKSPRSDEKHKPIITAIAEAKQTKSATSNWVSASSVKLSSPSLRSIDREGFTDAESKDSGRVFQSTDPLIMQSNYMAELENSVTGHSRLKSHTGAVISKESNYKIKNNIDSSVVQPFSFDADDDNTISFSRSHGIKQRVEAKV